MQILDPNRPEPSVNESPAPSLSGEAYHRQITASPRDIRARQIFHDLIGDMLPANAEVLDFGAGTGIDAHILVSQGHRMHVFEPDPAMLSYLRQHCAQEIDGRRISVVPDVADVPPVDAIISNFAVLNLVPDRPATFRQLHAVLKPQGFILAGLLNPWFLGDARYPWWRQNLPRLITHGGYSVTGGNGPIARVTTRALAREAAPWFDLARVEPTGLSMTQHLFMFVRLNRREC